MATIDNIAETVAVTALTGAPTTEANSGIDINPVVAEANITPLLIPVKVRQAVD